MRALMWGLCLLWVWLPPLCAHPLGNASTNRLAVLSLNSDHIALRYVLDLAEIPTLLAEETADSDGNGVVSRHEWNRYAWARAQQIRRDLVVRLDERPLPLRVIATGIAEHEGAAGLKTVQLIIRYAADWPGASGRGRLDYRDASQLAALVWSEVVVSGTDRVRVLESTVPQQARSQNLTHYPAAEAADYPNVAAAHAEIEWQASPMAAPAPIALASATPGPVATTPPASPPPAAPIMAQSDPLDRGAPGIAQPWAFFKLGMHHIAIGWDHLAFLAGLLFLGLNWRGLVKIVTAFTLAHSVTLILAVMGWVRPPAAWVEPAIALSVAYVGYAALRRHAKGHELGLSFGFGLVHGFGFAGAMQASLGAAAQHPTGWAALLSFNLGIEVFQLALISLAAPALMALRRVDRQHRLPRAGGAVVMTAGLGWFLSRTVL